MNRRTFFGMCGAILVIGAILAFAPSTFGSHEFSGFITNVSGWLWGGTTDTTLGPASINSATGLGWVNLHCNPGANPSAPECTSASASYGIRIPPSNGAVMGYAWSSNVGWLRFDAPPDPVRYPGCGYPAAPCSSAGTGVRRVENSLVGWARFESIKTALATPVSAGGVSAPNNSGNWEGWVKFSSSYVGQIGGVTYNGVQIVGGLPNQDIRGFAWSNEFGWIQWGGLASASDDPEVIFPPGAITCTLNVNPPSGSAPPPFQGQLSWNITSGQTSYTSCSFNPSSGPISGGVPIPANFPVTGSVQYGPISSNTTYTLDCTNANTAPAENGSCSVAIPVTNISVVTVQATDADASEPGTNTGTFRITRTGNTANALPVQFVMSGTATLGGSNSDYVLSDSSPAVIPAGTASVDVALTPVDNSIQEPTETAVLTLTPVSSYSVGSPSSATVSIADDDGPEADIRANGSGGTVNLPTGVTTATLTWCGAGSTQCANATGGCTVREGSLTGPILSTANPGNQPVTIPTGTSQTYHLQCFGSGGSSATDAVTVNAGGQPEVNLAPVSCFPSVQISPPNVTVGFEASGGTLVPGAACPANTNCTPLYQWSAPGASNSGTSNSCANADPNTQQPAICFGPNFSAQYPPPPESHTVTVTNVRPQLEGFTATGQDASCDVLIQIEVPP